MRACMHGGTPCELAAEDGYATHQKRNGGRVRALSRLLLGQTVQGAESEDEIDGVDARYRAIFEEFSQDAKSDAIVRIIEGRHQHGLVGDVEIGVTGRQPPPIKMERRGHR